MGAQAYLFDDSYVADAALAQYRVVVAGTTKNHVRLPTAQDANAIIGVTQHSTSASGDTVLVRRAGRTKIVVATGNLTYGVPLRIHDLQGRTDRQAAAWVSGDGVVGYSEEASAASGDIIECFLGIRTLLG